MPASALAAIALLVSGCAAQPPAQTPRHTGETLAEVKARAETIALAEPPLSDVVCAREPSTGTLIARERRCATREQRARESAAAQAWLRSGGRHGWVTQVHPL